MVSKTYEIRLVADGIEELRDKEGIKKPLNDTSNIVTKEPDEVASKANKEVVSAISAGVGYTLLASDLIGSYQQTNYAITGDSVGARNAAQTQKMVNSGISLASGLALGYAVKGVAGLTAMAATKAVQLGLSAIRYNEEMRRYNAELHIESIEKNYMRDRLSKTASEVRR